MKFVKWVIKIHFYLFKIHITNFSKDDIINFKFLFLILISNDLL